MSDSNIMQAATYLAQRYESGEPLDIMLQDFTPTTIEDAYKVQDALLHIAPFGRTLKPPLSIRDLLVGPRSPDRPLSAAQDDYRKFDPLQNVLNHPYKGTKTTRDGKGDGIHISHSVEISIGD